MVIRDSHLNSPVLPYKKQTMVVLCGVREALAEVRPNTTPLERSTFGVLRERAPSGRLRTRKLMTIHLRPATLEDVAFLADVVITVTLAQGRFLRDVDLVEYRAGYEEWTRETILGAIPDCTLSVIEDDGYPMGRLRVVRTQMNITLAGIQLLPAYQNRRIGSTLVEQLKREAELRQVPLYISVEIDHPRAQRLYQRLGCRIVGQDEKEYHLEYRPAMPTPFSGK
jgi:ribosomal protein S18 acetylase RimI-like enzyme